MKKNIDIFAFYEYNHYAINYPVFKIIASDKELYHYKTCLHLGLPDFIMPSLATPQINLQLIYSSFSKRSNPNLPKLYKFNPFKNY